MTPIAQQPLSPPPVDHGPVCGTCRYFIGDCTHEVWAEWTPPITSANETACSAYDEREAS